ncbi:MAG: DNA-binding response regulator [Cytophagales bacterium]|nr:MAG: DNA-binding response regulator [Cytophagales bacterium]TAF61252.1 MAG: DNA-binding response regulator [Cytophagales bacterium]
MKPKAKILFVEDDLSLGFVTKDNLEWQGYTVTHCADGLEAEEVFKKGEFDICVLDVMLPKQDGFTLAQKIRQRNQDVPIIFLTAKSLKEDRIHGLKIGADDYLTKPFSIEELVLKIEIFLKRNKVGASAVPSRQVFDLGTYTFDFENLELKHPEEVQKLTLREGEVLRFFCLNPDRVLKREDILNTIWGDDDYFIGRSLDVFISRLRKCFKHDPNVKIENVHGVGFKLINP